MAKEKAKSKPVYYVKTDTHEIGPFRTREAALAEARELKADGESVNVRREFPSAEAKGRKAKDKTDDIKIEGEDDDDDDSDDDDDDDDPDDDKPADTHAFFRKLGKG